MTFSQITLGTVQLGLNYGIANQTGKPDFDVAHKILREAINSGVNAFDTAPVYGDSESIIGKFFSSCEEAQNTVLPIIITKVPVPKIKGDFTAIFNEMEKSINQSLDFLQLEQIPICLLHSASASDMMREDGIIIRSLLELRDRGYIGKTGVTVYNPEDVEEFIQDNQMDAIQVPLNLFDQRLLNTGLLENLHQKQKIVFARSIFLQGLFFLDLNQIPPYLSDAEKYLKELNQISQEFDISIPQLAFNFVQSLPGITSLVIGVETVDQLRANLDLVNEYSINDSIRERVFDTFSDLPEEIIDPSKWKKNS